MSGEGQFDSSRALYDRVIACFENKLDQIEDRLSGDPSLNIRKLKPWLENAIAFLLSWGLDTRIDSDSTTALTWFPWGIGLQSTLAELERQLSNIHKEREAHSINNSRPTSVLSSSTEQQRAASSDEEVTNADPLAVMSSLISGLQVTVRSARMMQALVDQKNLYHDSTRQIKNENSKELQKERLEELASPESNETIFPVKGSFEKSASPATALKENFENDMSLTESKSWIPAYDVQRLDSSFIDDAQVEANLDLQSPNDVWTALTPDFEESHGIPEARLCSNCRKIFSGQKKGHELGNEATHSLGQTLAMLIASAADGCQLCELRVSQLKNRTDWDLLSTTSDIKFGFAESRVGNQIVFTYKYKTISKALNDQISVVDASGMKLTSQSSVLRRLEHGVDPTHTPILRHIQSSSNSFTSVKIAQKWITDCIQNHSICKRASPRKRSLPTRLIYLGSGKEVRPRLCYTSELSVTTPYATLSHCWGGLVPLKLLATNEETLLRYVPVDKLSRTFREAMEFAKRLGLRYIWIDSLCIVQDSNSDWIREASKMGDYYHNTTVNIGASDASNGAEGCFRRRTLEDVEPCKVELRWRGHEASTLYCFNSGAFVQNNDESPLLKRAWVIQEVALAPRLLDFGRKQVFWKCLERQASETFPDGIWNRRPSKLSIDPWVLDDDFMRSARPGLERFQLWEILVDAYSKADLTFKAKDKLVAISGLAKKLGPEDEYVAGLWKSCLPDQLLWSVHRGDDEDETKPTRSEEYRAPSWSWASIDGTVYTCAPFEATPGDIALQIIDVQVTPAPDHDATGRIERAFLQVKGTLACCQLIVRNEVIKQIHTFAGGKISTREARADEPKKFIIRNYLAEAHWRETGRNKSSLCPLANVVLDTQDKIDGMQFFCLLVRSSDDHKGGLILAPAANAGEYTRIGWFAVLGAPRPQNYADFLSMCKNSAAAIESNPRRYQRKCGNNSQGIPEYIITLL